MGQPEGTDNQRYSQVVDRTPEAMQCIGGMGCPAIYEVVDRTPTSFNCAIGPCPGIYEAREGGADFDRYLIIGKQIDPVGTGLEAKVGKGEVLIKVPRKLIDDMDRGDGGLDG